MRNLLNSDLKKIVFHALATGLSVEKVATHLGLSSQEVKEIFQNAITDISIQSGFVRAHIDNGIRREIEIDKLKSNIQSLKTQLTKDEIKHPAPKRTSSQIPYVKQKKLLSKPLTHSLDLETRTLTILKAVDIYTLEDLLKFISTNGLAALKKRRNFGNLSLNKLEKELIRKGIFDPSGHCELYQEIAKR